MLFRAPDFLQPAEFFAGQEWTIETSCGPDDTKDAGEEQDDCEDADVDRREDCEQSVNHGASPEGL
jgi:hypothetical protein